MCFSIFSLQQLAWLPWPDVFALTWQKPPSLALPPRCSQRLRNWSTETLPLCLPCTLSRAENFAEPTYCSSLRLRRRSTNHPKLQDWTFVGKPIWGIQSYKDLLKAAENLTARKSWLSPLLTLKAERFGHVRTAGEEKKTMEKTSNHAPMDLFPEVTWVTLWSRIIVSENCLRMHCSSPHPLLRISRQPHFLLVAVCKWHVLMLWPTELPRWCFAESCDDTTKIPRQPLFHQQSLEIKITLVLFQWCGKGHQTDRRMKAD